MAHLVESGSGQSGPDSEEKVQELHTKVDELTMERGRLITTMGLAALLPTQEDNGWRLVR